MGDQLYKMADKGLLLVMTSTNYYKFVVWFGKDSLVSILDFCGKF